MGGMDERAQSLGEEIANSLSHGVALLVAVVGAPFLIVASVRHGTAVNVVGASVFAATMLLLYFASTLYHAVPHPRAKRLLQKLDHGAIYLLIAGTYTPFTLGVLGGPWGWTLFGLVWALAIVGVTLKAFDHISHPVWSTGLYLVMGWLVVIAVKPMLSSIATPGLVLLAAGGFFYTLGVAFFALDSRVRYGHFVWHLFVIAGTTCHFFAVLFYAV
jgi:hemolysin III